MVRPLGSSTLKVYIHMVENGNPATIRGIQRALSFGSPATAQYHLKRLERMGVITESAQAGGYIITKKVRPSFLALFIFLSGRLIPKSLLYFIASILVNVASAFLLPLPGWLLRYALIPGLIGSLLLLIETVSVWRMKNRVLRD